MNNGRKLTSAIKATSEITRLVFDLRVLFAKMSERQKSLFIYMVRGYNELQILLLAKRIRELSGAIPTIKTITGQRVKTSSLTSFADLKRLNLKSYTDLQKLAKGHIQASMGNVDYNRLITEITWFLNLLIPQAGLAVIEILVGKKTSSYTRLMAAKEILDRIESWQQQETEATLPVRAVINYPPEFNEPKSLTG